METQLDKLMFDCWRAGFKTPKILERAKQIDPNITEAEVQQQFKVTFERELSEDSIYLT